jgi:hypothetical protein
VAEERNAAVLELRALLLESESESIVGGSEMAYKSQKKAEKSEKGRVCALRASTIPLPASIRHSPLPSSSPSRGPPSVTGPTGGTVRIVASIAEI